MAEAGTQNNENPPATKDISDVFDDIFLVEDRYREAGYKDGFKDGLEKASEDAFLTGVTHGLAISREVGMYSGFAKAHLETLQSNGDGKHRAKKTLETMASLCDKLTLTDPQYPTLFEEMEVLRAKYKQACSMLGVKSESKAADLSY